MYICVCMRASVRVCLCAYVKCAFLAAKGEHLPKLEHMEIYSQSCHKY